MADILEQKTDIRQNLRTPKYSINFNNTESIWVH